MSPKQPQCWWEQTDEPTTVGGELVLDEADMQLLRVQQLQPQALPVVLAAAVVLAGAAEEAEDALVAVDVQQLLLTDKAKFHRLRLTQNGQMMRAVARD